jgi:hypothetical protein
VDIGHIPELHRAALNIIDNCNTSAVQLRPLLFCPALISIAQNRFDIAELCFPGFEERRWSVQAYSEQSQFEPNDYSRHNYTSYTAVFVISVQRYSTGQLEESAPCLLRRVQCQYQFSQNKT